MTPIRPSFPLAAGRAHASAAGGLAPLPSGSPEPPPTAWQAAVIRLAWSTEKLSDQIGVLMRTPAVTPPVIRELVEQLVDWLDEVEGDPDYELTGDDEPSLGSHEIEPAGAVVYLPSWSRVSGLDVEEQCDDEGAR